MKGFELSKRLREEAEDVAREDRRDLFLEAAREIESLTLELREKDERLRTLQAAMNDSVERRDRCK